jgi:hypothetical protein
MEVQARSCPQKVPRSSPVQTASGPSRKNPLGDVRGRIDHLAVDLKRNRKFAAELGKDTVDVVDLNEQKVQHVITGLKEPPQGMGYVPSSARFSSRVRVGLGTAVPRARITPRPVESIAAMMPTIFGVDSVPNRVFVGHASGALAGRRLGSHSVKL